MKNRLILFITVLLTGFLLVSKSAYAFTPLDEIQEYNITVDVNDDATVNLVYHIDWLVLDSDGGGVTWVQIGIPNDHYVSMEGYSDSIRSISYTSDYGQSYARIDLDKEYMEGEHILMDYLVVMDYMYEVDKFTDNETVYSFTPGWFDEIEVKSMTLKWSADKAISWTPSCLTKGGYLTWEESLSPGETFSIDVTYPTDAYAFDTSKTIEYNYDYDYDYDYEYDSDYKRSPLESIGWAIGTIFGAIFSMVFFFGPFILVIWLIYKAGKGFSKPATTTRKEVKRTLIKYYPTCPGCGAARPEGKEKCDYCGRSFIESEEVIEEKDIPNPTQYSSEGLYRYNDNSAIRVHVVNIPVVTTRSSYSSSSRSSSGSSHHSSCAHSSCACAHSCACACACACAGGGRAGCTTKDFYNTGLKLSHLQKMKGKKK